ncbi:hypothetical protein AB0O07_12615 [Streptomyces sp. NPDC093085]|uniref:hypothetical protein n=1 Tax=Streptomyces sp. NPDC093085 TaxID=3155068 RepID=UPI00341F5AFC
MGGEPRGHIGARAQSSATGPVALLCALATLLAALAVCLAVGTGPGHGHHGAGGTARTASAGGSASGFGSGSFEGSGSGSVSVPGSASADDPVSVSARGGNADDAQYVCPFRDGGCGLSTRLNAAVLTVPPPPAAPAVAVQPPYLAPPRPAGRTPRPGVLGRAPDLHVLQVLRT